MRTDNNLRAPAAALRVENLESHSLLSNRINDFTLYLVGEGHVAIPQIRYSNKAPLIGAEQG